MWYKTRTLAKCARDPEEPHHGGITQRARVAARVPARAGAERQRCARGGQGRDRPVERVSGEEQEPGIRDELGAGGGVGAGEAGGAGGFTGPPPAPPAIPAFAGR